MTEYGTGNQRVSIPTGTCFYPRSPSILCDRDGHHSGRHAAYNDNGKRIYWTDTPL